MRASGPMNCWLFLSTFLVLISRRWSEGRFDLVVTPQGFDDLSSCRREAANVNDGFNKPPTRTERFDRFVRRGDGKKGAYGDRFGKEVAGWRMVRNMVRGKRGGSRRR